MTTPCAPTTAVVCQDGVPVSGANLSPNFTLKLIALPEAGPLGMHIGSMTWQQQNTSDSSSTTGKDVVIVKSVMKGSQAERFGVQNNDIICHPPPSIANKSSSTSPNCPPPIIEATRSELIEWTQSPKRPVTFLVKRILPTSTCPTSVSSLLKSSTASSSKYPEIISKQSSNVPSTAPSSNVPSTAPYVPGYGYAYPPHPVTSKPASLPKRKNPGKKRSSPSPSPSPSPSSTLLPCSQKFKKKKEEVIYHPNPGTVDPTFSYYATLNNESCKDVAAKLGLDEWQSLATHKENKRYGKIRAKTKFQAKTLLAIPKGYSKWKTKKLVDELGSEELEKEAEKKMNCIVCKSHEEDEEKNPLLLCDGCDCACHLKCTPEKLAEVPEGDWFCMSCMDILKARRDTHYTNSNQDEQGMKQASFAIELPLLPKTAMTLEQENTPNDGSNITADVKKKFFSHRYEKAKHALEQTHKAIRESLISQEKSEKKNSSKAMYYLSRAKSKCQDHLFRTHRFIVEGNNDYDGYPNTNTKLCRYDPKTARYYPKSFFGTSYTEFREAARDCITKRFMKKVAEWQTKVNSIEDLLSSVSLELSSLDSQEEKELEALSSEYSAMQEEPLPTLGYVELETEMDLNYCYMLSEPDEYCFFCPHQPKTTSTTNTDDGDYELVIGNTYIVFCRSTLFDEDRDDNLPIDRNGIRDAQRRLIELLSNNRLNAHLCTTQCQTPDSVHVRGEDSTSSKLFDLTELVRDCNCDLSLPKTLTPVEMAKNGVELHPYQQSSLRWMLDKENESTGLGTAAEIWSRHQLMDGKGEYFFCKLTGSLSLNIFKTCKQTKQRKTQIKTELNFGKMPNGGILGEEMGLGKTMICLALVVANPPPTQNRILRREHIWELEKHQVQHKDYSLPLTYNKLNVKKTYVSNGTLVVVPMTLLSQWETEIERYAPWLSVVTLHSSESLKIQNVASADICLASTWLMQQRGGSNGKAKGLLAYIQKIHWHRVIIDEAHYNQGGTSRTKEELSSISATHRFCVTGTPIGHSLDDLQGQLAFLRLPPFNRQAFWKNNISEPYYNHDKEALRIVRSLLSRLVVRHSKEQTFSDGQSVVRLPPRSIETILLNFGSKEEEGIYNEIETRNRNYIISLQRQSFATVASHYIELVGMMSCARQVCSHISMLDVHKYDTTSRSIDPKYNQLELEKTITNVSTRKEVLAHALQKARPSAKDRARKLILQFQKGEITLIECPVCLEPIGESEAAITPCGHIFCNECVISILQAASRTREAQGKCPTCRDNILRSELTFLGDAKDTGPKENNNENEGTNLAINVEEETILNGFTMRSKDIVVTDVDSSTARASADQRGLIDIENDYLPTISRTFVANHRKCFTTIGTKVARLLEEINTMIQNDKTSKCVVFSQFHAILNVAGEELAARNIRFVRVDGHVSQHKRADALLEFSSNPNTKVFLLSMRSGAVGLTLTSADHCFILDTPQNSAVEEQAIERIHRIGQTRPVTVKRFVMKNTVEERILQERRNLNSECSIASTALCAMNFVNENETVTQTAKATNSSEDDSDLSGRQQERVKRLMAMFGCDPHNTRDTVVMKA